MKHRSPFKFLDAFQKEDKGFFFGREEETQALYEMAYDTRLILLYGTSGSGKTSLLQCGLANRFSETRWKDYFIRREDNVLATLQGRLNAELEQLGQKPEAEPVAALEKIQQYTFKPVYLIFDQFEELFILGDSREEAVDFFDFLNRLLHANLPVTAILSMREEFIASLWEFEHTVPQLFHYRYRVERMRAGRVEEVVLKTLRALETDGQLRVEEIEEVARQICTQLEASKSGMELAYLQVYLDRLYQEASRQNPSRAPLFNPALAHSLGSIDDVIGDFLDEQLAELEQRLGPGKEGIPIRLLGALVTDEQTKKILSMEALQEIQKKYGLTDQELERCLQAFESMRILKRYEET